MHKNAWPLLLLLMLPFDDDVVVVVVVDVVVSSSLCEVPTCLMRLPTYGGCGETLGRREGAV